MLRLKIAFGSAGFLALMVILFTGGRTLAGSFIYDNFDSTSGLILQAHASSVDGKLRLSPAIPGLGLGGAWLDAKQPVKDGFDTTFLIQITDKYVYGADGLAFAIENRPAPALGYAGRNIGYGGLTNLLVVKFDDYHWRNHKFVAFDEIAVMAADSPTTKLWDGSADTIASVKKGVVFSDGAVHTVRILYVPGNLQVFLDDLKNPLMTVYVNLARDMNLDDGRAWVGFTAASGADWQNQDLISWEFDSPSAPNPGEARDPAQTEMTHPMPPPAPVYWGDNEPVAPITPLPADPAFGYRLPDNVGLGYQIEASTNLEEWTPLTNAAFYFRDPKSTNYPQRFYRFQKN
jgi:Bacterial lectin